MLRDSHSRQDGENDGSYFERTLFRWEMDWDNTYDENLAAARLIEKEPGMERKYTEKAARNGAHHAFMICEDEHIGLGPYNASVGDLVCVLHGGDVPFILRQAPAGRYYMMGEAFVDGIMHGEATQMAWRNWNPVETFTLI